MRFSNSMSFAQPLSTSIPIKTTRPPVTALNVASELRYQKVNLAGTVNDHTLLTGDINGDGLVDFTIWVNGLIDLKGADFVL